MLLINGLQELKNYIGQELGASDWLVITQERINAFAQATSDQQWIHTDTERALAELPEGKTIAHGFLTLSLAPIFKEQIYKLEGVRMAINYGLNKVRFTAPVLVENKLRMRIKLLQVKDVADGCIVITLCTFEVEGQAQPVCLAETVSVFYR